MINCSTRRSPFSPIMDTPAAADKLQLNSTHNGNTNHNDRSIRQIINSDNRESMIPVIEPVGYTSLRDLLPASPSTTTTDSPTVNNSSWHEIPIKNHLVKQAAMAYLQPACSLPEIGRKDLFGRLKDAFGCEECGCVFWFNDVVLKYIIDLFSIGKKRSDDYDYDNDDDDDYEEIEEDDYEKEVD